MVDPKLARAYGTLVGFGFIGVALLVLPSTRLLEPAPAPEAYLVTLLALVVGLVCLAVPWDLIHPGWLHLVGVAATAVVAVTVAVFGTPYVVLYFLVGLVAAYLSPDVRTLGSQLGIIAVALVGPVAYGPEDPRVAALAALLVIPVLLVTASLFSYLRLKMVHDRRAYHRFAEQTLVLSSQIAGRQVAPLRPLREAEPFPRVNGARPPVRLAAVLAAVLGIPLFAGSLAVAGVRLPDAATAPFERIGIELPNQEEAVAGLRPAVQFTKAVAVTRARPGGDQGESEAAPAPKQSEQKSAAGSSGGGEAPQAPPDAAPFVPAPVPVPGSGGSVSPPPSSQPGSPDSGKPSGPITSLLDQATQGLQGLLDEIRSGATP